MAPARMACPLEHPAWRGMPCTAQYLVCDPRKSWSVLDKVMPRWGAFSAKATPGKENTQSCEAFLVWYGSRICAVFRQSLYPQSDGSCMAFRCICRFWRLHVLAVAIDVVQTRNQKIAKGILKYFVTIELEGESPIWITWTSERVSHPWTDTWSVRIYKANDAVMRLSFQIIIFTNWGELTSKSQKALEKTISDSVLFGSVLE
jgi:hypothetical protein